jgi:hypothetical protein
MRQSTRETYSEHRRSILECIEYYEKQNEPKGVAHCKKTLADSDRIQTRDTKKRIKSELLILLDLHDREKVLQILKDALNETMVEGVMSA